MTRSARVKVAAEVAAVVLLVALAIAFGAWYPRQLGAGNSMDHPAAVNLALLPSTVAQNYRFVEANAELATHIPCYCGCGVALGHQSLRDCYLKDPGYNDHAVYCTICGRIATEVETLAPGSTDVRAIRAAIDRDFTGTGPPTNTPKD